MARSVIKETLDMVLTARGWELRETVYELWRTEHPQCDNWPPDPVYWGDWKQILEERVQRYMQGQGFSG